MRIHIEKVLNGFFANLKTWISGSLSFNSKFLSTSATGENNMSFYYFFYIWLLFFTIGLIIFIIDVEFFLFLFYYLGYYVDLRGIPPKDIPF
jgi:hypothetical protein